MAKVIQNEHSAVIEPWWVQGKIMYIGLAMGLLWWILTAILQQYVVEPYACRDLTAAEACVNSMGVSGSIAAVLVAVAGLFLLIRYIQPRPIIIAVASAILLWDLGILVNGLAWWAAILWALALYAVAYLLFMLVSRIRWLALSLALAAILVVGIRLLLII